jgi:hypothetical protein
VAAHDPTMNDQTMNREQRRRAQFGGSGPSGLRNDVAKTGNPGAMPPPMDGLDESQAGGEDQSQTRLTGAGTGAGTGGATEAPERTPRHSGAHVQHSTNG